jgi:hypothetical protein
MNSFGLLLLSFLFLSKLVAYADMSNLQYKFNRALRAGNFDAIISMVYDNPTVCWQSGLEAVKLAVEIKKSMFFDICMTKS